MDSVQLPAKVCRMGGLETFFATIGAALVGGLAIMATRSPRRFRRIVPYLGGAVACVYIVGVIYRIAGDQVRYAMNEYIRADKIGAAHAATASVQPDMILLFGFTVGASVYLVVLLLLPGILKIGDDGDDEDDQPQK